MRLHSETLTSGLAIALLVGVLYLTRPYYNIYKGFQTLYVTGAYVPHSKAQHPLLIAQHLPQSTLASASRKSHALYAQAWGYSYIGDTTMSATQGVYPPLDRTRMIKRLLEQQMDRPTLENHWIICTDADTVVADPAVPLHVLLPPPDVTPEPFFLLSQGPDGLETSAFALRVSPLALQFVNAVLSLAASNPDPDVIDAHYIHALLWSNATFSEHVYEMPRDWMNAGLDDYAPPPPPPPPALRKALTTDEDRRPPQWQVRLESKSHIYSIVKSAARIYAMAHTNAQLRGSEHSSLDALERATRAAEMARQWWAEHGRLQPG